MPFTTKNVYHLRLTEQRVLPFFVYLDDRHVDWMTNAILKAVVSDLRPIIGPKLESERNAHFGPGGPANAQRPTVEVHRGVGYQFAYFLRKAEPYAVVAKTRNYVLLPPKTKRFSSALPQIRPGGKRKFSAPVALEKPKRPRNSGLAKVKGKAKATDIIADSDSEAEESPLSELESDEPGDQPSKVPRRRSTRTHGQVARSYRELEDSDEEEADVPDQNGALPPTGTNIEQQPVTDDPTEMLVDEEEEEEKPKPLMQLAFRSLTMHDRYLCVVVEPWPPLPTIAMSRAPSVAPGTQTSRTPSIAPPDFIPSIPEREETPMPLFLPDFDRRSATPAPIRFGSVFSTLQTMDEDPDPLASDDNFGMLEFSQMLNSVAGENTAGVEEDDEIDGSVLYGDADEMRSIVQ